MSQSHFHDGVQVRYKGGTRFRGPLYSLYFSGTNNLSDLAPRQLAQQACSAAPELLEIVEPEPEPEPAPESERAQEQEVQEQEGEPASEPAPAQQVRPPAGASRRGPRR